jgi:dipeptidyl-peptidase-4
MWRWFVFVNRGGSRAAILLAVAAIGLAAQAEKRPITVHDLVAGEGNVTVPEPIWRPDGNAFAYEENGEIWLYDIPSRHASAWLKLPEGRTPRSPFQWQNRRVDKAGPQWFPDNKRLLVPAPDALEIAELGRSTPVATFQGIDADNVPALSPDGTAVLFRRGGNLYVLTLASRKIVRLTFDATSEVRNGQLDWVYPEELDLGKAFWWAPDSKRIVYMQFDVSQEFVYPHADLLVTRAIFEPQRYPQSGTPNAIVRVGVVSRDGGKTDWLSLSAKPDDLIARVLWLPGSKEVAVEKLNRVQNRLDLVIADAAGGAARVILTEHDKTWININNDLRFLTKQPAFLWSSERSGFRHLYLYSLRGKQIRQLTSGDWQVNGVSAVDEEHGFVYYTSAETSPIEDQLYRARLDGGDRQRVSASAGMHAISMEPGARYYQDAFSNLTTPPEVTLHAADGSTVATIKAADRAVLDRLNLLPVEIVKLTAGDGTLLYARLIKPANFNPTKKYPAIVFVYGGPQAQSVHNVWNGVSWEQILANKGFVIWQVDNRGSFGRGHAFESPVYHELGKIELSDQRAGVEKLLSMGYVDRDRIGIYGWSYGGYMTIYSLLHAPDLFRVGVAGAPVTDWHNYDTIYTERYMGLPSKNPEGYEKSSNVRAAANLNGKLLIVCNFEDDNVLFQNTMQMMTALHHANKEFEFMLYPQKTHGVSGDLREGMYRQMTDFFVNNLHP